MAFFLITATLYLTALALAHRITDSEYTDALLSSPPPHSHDVYNYSHPIVTTCLYIRRRFCRQSSVVVFIPSELVISAPTRVSV